VSDGGDAQHVCGIVVRMSDKTVSLAARQLSAGRWGSQKPVRLARELELRVDELPEAERARLLEALTTETRQTRDLAAQHQRHRV
jgi:hypothetical protein